MHVPLLLLVVTRYRIWYHAGISSG